MDLGTGTVTLNATRQVTVSANNLTVGGVISGSTFGLTKAGAGNLTLNGANGYSGATTINGGTITANTLANGGSNSSIGSSSNVASNLVLNGGVLQYDGTTAASTNRLFTIGTAGAQLWNNSSSSSSTLNFTNAGAITVSGTGDRPLTLRGLNTGNNTLSPILVNPSSGMLSIVADNAGKWILAGNNTYTGTTTVSAGTLLINGVQTSATGNVNVSGGGTLLGGIGKTGGKVTIGGGGTPGSGSVIPWGRRDIRFRNLYNPKQQHRRDHVEQRFDHRTCTGRVRRTFDFGPRWNRNDFVRVESSVHIPGFRRAAWAVFQYYYRGRRDYPHCPKHDWMGD